ncbi:gamma carbonic anhydrase family protein [Runella slithyformis]|uniref:gamma carbonic anhydrase family protein n=1 Tax=Runella slithyformis TaxID=106 RepID=UPI00146DCAA6|nr:hypothetical protein [Runella slithyformis]
MSVRYGAVIQADVEKIIIGHRTNIQDAAVLHADEGSPTLIGDDVTVGHGAIVHGAVVGSGCGQRSRTTPKSVDSVSPVPIPW